MKLVGSPNPWNDPTVSDSLRPLIPPAQLTGDPWVSSQLPYMPHSDLYIPQEVVHGTSMQSAIRYLWISFCYLNLDAICKVLLTFGFLMSRGLQMPACNCRLFQCTIPAIQQILQCIIVFVLSLWSTLLVRNGLTPQTP